MLRIACGIEYDGSSFCGWQRQSGAASVQQELERALSQVADQPVRCAAAGRTDAGVHAAGQVVHFDTQARRSRDAWRRGAGGMLPDAISISWARPVAADFHARYSAQRRHYRYIMLPGAARCGLLAHRVACSPAPLDAARMHEAAQGLLGTHDFSSFRAAACQARAPVRTLHRLDVTAHGPFVHLDAEADGFLHHMVRILAGALMEVGAGARSVQWPQKVLQMRARAEGGATAPSAGLYLVRVHYPARFRIPPPPWTPSYHHPPGASA